MNIPATITTPKSYIEEQKLISTSKFVIFSILSFGLYNYWWMFKEWRFFQQKENIKIMPAFRAIFAIFFLYSLLKRIISFAESAQYSKNYSSGFLYIAYIFTPILTSSMDPYGVIIILTTVYLIPAFQAINYAKRNSENIQTIELNKLTTPQIILVILGSIFWLLVIASFFILNKSQ